MAELKRFFVDTIEPNPVLSGEEFEHAKNVLRLGVGDEVILLDNSGKEYSAVLSKAEKRSFTLTVTGETVGEKEPNTEMVLAFGYLKNADKNEFIVQKAVELGVSKLVAFSSEFSSAYMSQNKLERLQKVAREATKQCLRSKAPSVEYAEDFASVLAKADGYKNKLFACEFAQKSDVSLQTLDGSCFLVVGSEGGFSKAEAEQASAKNFQKITLGKRILRAETACVALLSVVAFAVGELGEVQ